LVAHEQTHELQASFAVSFALTWAWRNKYKPDQYSTVHVELTLLQLLKRSSPCWSKQF
jgi:hypothetical protein